MENLSREEKLRQRISELEMQIIAKDHAFEKEQGKRLRRTFFAVCGVLYLLAFLSDILESTKDYFYCLLCVPMIAGWIMFISFGIWFYVMNGTTEKVKTLAKLEAELDTIKNFDYRYK